VTLARALLTTAPTTAPSHDAATVTTDTAPRATWACPHCGAAMVVGPILSALQLAIAAFGFDTS
jgi:hypothetical protein